MRALIDSSLPVGLDVEIHFVAPLQNCYNILLMDIWCWRLCASLEELVWRSFSTNKITTLSRLSNINSTILVPVVKRCCSNWSITQSHSVPIFVFKTCVRFAPNKALQLTMSDARYCIEYAKTGRSSCKKCKQAIDKGLGRIGKITANPFSDDGGEMKVWYHTKCMFETLKVS